MYDLYVLNGSYEIVCARLTRSLVELFIFYLRKDVIRQILATLCFLSTWKTTRHEVQSEALVFSWSCILSVLPIITGTRKAEHSYRRCPWNCSAEAQVFP